MSVWEIVGYGLLAWACYDIAKGRTYLLRSISRAEEPLFFWPVALAWAAFGAYLIVKY